jgi:hemerythrin
MDEITLTDDLLTGEETVDYQHKILVACINDLIRANKLGDNVELVVEISLDELIKYTVHHFGDEERIMKERGYANLPGHQKQHKEFKEKVLEYKQRHGNGEKVIDDFLKFLVGWLITHIKHEDQIALKHK